MYVEPTDLNREINSRLLPAILLLRLRRNPYPWEVRLGTALVFGEMAVARVPEDAGLRLIHEAAAFVVDSIQYNGQ